MDERLKIKVVCSSKAPPHAPPPPPACPSSHIKPIKEQRDRTDPWQLLLLGALSSVILYGDPSSVAAARLRSTGKYKPAASTAAVLGSPVCPERFIDSI